MAPFACHPINLIPLRLISARPLSEYAARDADSEYRDALFGRKFSDDGKVARFSLRHSC